MMTDPATAIKREVFQLIDQQIETLRGEGHLTDSDLDQFRLRSGRISDLYQEHDRMVRSRVSPLLRLAKDLVASPRFEGVQAVAPSVYSAARGRPVGVTISLSLFVTHSVLRRKHTHKISASLELRPARSVPISFQRKTA